MHQKNKKFTTKEGVRYDDIYKKIPLGSDNNY